MNLKSIAAGLVSALAVASASAAPVITRTAFFTENIGPNINFGPSAGQYLQLDLGYNSSGSAASASAFARYSLNPSVVLPLFYYSGGIFPGGNFDIFSSNVTRTAAWNVSVTDNTGTGTGILPAIASPEFIPLLANLQVLANGTTPTLNWVLPDLTGFDVDRIRVRVIDAASDIQIFASVNLAANATSYVIPTGVLQNGRNYEFRVLLEDLENGFLENRSNTFVEYSAVPEPTTAALLGLALLGIVASNRRRQP
jgi:hypothetical protein